ncbi:MAG: hypothetical protein ACYCQI_16215 [Gammaproteobacteria bacterium]
MKTRKPEIKTEGLNVIKFDQTKLIAGTPHDDGLCGPLSQIFVDRTLGNRSVADFKKHSSSLYKEAVTLSDALTAKERDGDIEDPDSSVFSKHGLLAKSAALRQDQLATHLQGDGTSVLKYPTLSGGIHLLAFSKTHNKCHAFDPNRFIISGSCLRVKKTILDIIARSNPDSVKVMTGIKKP